MTTLVGAVRTVTSFPIFRRAVGTGILVLVERLAAPTLAYAFFFRAGTSALFVAVGASLILAARRTVERSFSVRNEAELYRRAVAAILSGNVLRPSLVPDQEARISLFQALNRAAFLMAQAVPQLAANLVAAALLAIWIVEREAPRVTAVACFAGSVGAGVVFLSRRWVDRAQRDAWAAWSVAAEGITDAYEARLDLVSAGREDDFLRRFEAAARRWEERTARAGFLGGLLGRLPPALAVAAVAAAVVAQARLESSGWSGAGARAGLLASCAPAFLGVAGCLQELASNAPRLRLVQRVLEQARPIVPAGSDAAVCPQRLEWKSVRFAYEHNGRDVLQNVSFSWQRGEILALAGSNGSGKSTCLRVALGLGTLHGGSMLIDDIPLSSFDVVRWRRSVTFLPQRPYVPLRATVRECLQLIDQDIAEPTMREALERVGLLAALKRYASNPLDASVGTLSAGEKQRVALARVLCRPAPVVLLDEPDANLDASGINRVAELLTELARERMVLVIAHTPKVLALADRVVTVEGGTVVSDVVQGSG